MKLQPDRLEGVNTIGGYTRSSVTVGATVWTASVLVPWQGSVTAWQVPGRGDLGADAFQALLAFGPELVIYGSGATLVFPPPALLRPLMAARIGLETMDTAAACRTYNVLATEGRRVVAALLI